MKQANPARANLWIFLGMLAIAATLIALLHAKGHITLYAAYPLGAAAMIGISAALRLRQSKEFSWEDTLSLFSIGIYDPEDERDESVKMRAGYVALLVTQSVTFLLFIGRWVALSQNPPANPLDVFGDFTLELLLTQFIIGQSVYQLTVRNKA